MMMMSTFIARDSINFNVECVEGRGGGVGGRGVECHNNESKEKGKEKDTWCKGINRRCAF